jgi:preprotein translocase subunit SecF
VEFFKNTNIDFLGKKWYFLGFSLIFSVAGLMSIFFWHHIPLGVDFKGGTLVYVQFPSERPDLTKIRGSLDAAGLKDPSIQSYGPPANNEVLIKLEQKETSESALDQGRAAIQNALAKSFDPKSFVIRSVEIVGPQVGAQLRHQALLATLYSLAGMLVYLWFRFELIYGVAAVVAVFHDTIITLGAFSLLNYELSLTVIAAILTLIGYSMNDTIVVFDRIRENLKTQRRMPLAELVNLSINQTLSRTILTSGLTFLTVLSLYLFGGEVLHGFSFALVVGILIGTYSSIAVAAPMLVAYLDSRGGKSRAVPVSIESGRREKQRA